MPRLRVRYVNGAEVTISPEAWPTIAADGVDYVDLDAGSVAYRVQGQSIYWLRQVDGRWAVGGGTVGHEQQIIEVVDVAGRFEQRTLEYMPDLPHSAVKLGWWGP